VLIHDSIIIEIKDPSQSEQIQKNHQYVYAVFNFATTAFQSPNSQKKEEKFIEFIHVPAIKLAAATAGENDRNTASGSKYYLKNLNPNIQMHCDSYPLKSMSKTPHRILQIRIVISQNPKPM